eukprot:346401-Prymnesium_polylepis.1
MAKQLEAARTGAHQIEAMEIEEAAAWADASAAAAEEAPELAVRAEAATAALQRARALIPSVPEATAALDAATARAASYDGMSQSLDALFKALMPCGQVTYPRISTVGGKEFQAYRRACTEGNCRHRMSQHWGGPSACGWEHVFGGDCPLESNSERCSWQGWEQRLRGVNDEGKPSYSPEFIPMHGTRMEMLKELRAKVTLLLCPPLSAHSAPIRLAARRSCFCPAADVLLHVLLR